MKRPLQKNQLLSPEVRPLTRKSPKPAPTIPKKKKDCDCPKGPPPTKAESDYIQNGLQLPQSKENLELLLKDIQQKGFLDKEYAYRLRQKEAVKGLQKRIMGQIEAGAAKGEGETDKGLEYDPLLESKMGLFERAFRRVLAEDIKSTSPHCPDAYSPPKPGTPEFIEDWWGTYFLCWLFPYLLIKKWTPR